MSGSTKPPYSHQNPRTQELERNKLQAYWRANTNLIRNLLIVWAVVSLGCSILLVQLLNLIPFGRLPLGFWMAQQGSIFVFVILIFVYAVQMDKIEQRYK